MTSLSDLRALAMRVPGDSWCAYRQDEDDGEIWWAIHASKDYGHIVNVHYNEAIARYIEAVGPNVVLKLLDRIATLEDALEKSGVTEMCSGCGSIESLAELRQRRGVISCCPERQMLPIKANQRSGG